MDPSLMTPEELYLATRRHREELERAAKVAELEWGAKVADAILQSVVDEFDASGELRWERK